MRPEAAVLYCTYGQRVPASCVLYVPEARGSLPWASRTVRTPYAYQPRACRTYRVPCGEPQVPKEELVGLLAKTNSRCRELEMRYAELKGLHQQLLEERRQLVVTKGKSGISMDAERESVEAELHA